MKKLTLTLVMALITASVIFAQPNTRTKHLMITVVDDHVAITIGHKPDNLFITRDDTAQVQSRIDLNPHVKNKDQLPAREEMTMQLLTPYYNAGWRLVTASTEVISQSLVTEIFRYYLVKEN